MIVDRDALTMPPLQVGSIATIGNFDGIHRGQQHILELIRNRAGETGLESVVVTFEPHPLTILRPQEAPNRLTTFDQKGALLELHGVDRLSIVQFTPAVAQTPARSFVRDFLHHRLKVQEIYVGSRFTFGRDREGDLSLLQTMGETFGFRAFGLEEVLYQDGAISSTRIRQELTGGGVEAAHKMLGRPYSITGLVARGDKRGKQLGWPTINIAPDTRPSVMDGVYACKVRFPSTDEKFLCATNVGTRPTVYEGVRRLVESHILEFERDVYGDRIELEFYARLRNERRFPSLEALSEQISMDVEATREYFRASDCYQNESGLSNLCEAGKLEK
ncbi:MAG: riboflavin biosynthesis protein RibF [Thermoanaerobaculia bacterium]